MHIEELLIHNFRNHKDCSFQFVNGINVITGKNGSGKTNILEAIHLMSTTMSHRTYKMKEMIRSGQDSFRITGKLKIDAGSIDIGLFYNNRGLSAFINNNKVRRSELLKSFPTVLFTPEDVQFLKGPPNSLRRIMNVFISQYDPDYITDLISFHKVLQERNALLRKGETSEKLYSVWTDALIKRAENIVLSRKNYIKLFNLAIEEELKEIKLDRKVYIKYNIKRYENGKSDQRDRLKSFTTWGPHRDKFSVMLDNMDIRKYGSRGETRIVAFIMRMSCWEILKKNRGFQPVALLDDIFGELDLEKREIISKRLSNIQSILTATEIPEKIIGFDRVISL